MKALAWVLLMVVAVLSVLVGWLGWQNHENQRQRRVEVCAAVNRLDAAVTAIIVDLRPGPLRERALVYLRDVECDPNEINGGG